MRRAHAPQQSGLGYSCPLPTRSDFANSTGYMIPNPRRPTPLPQKTPECDRRLEQRLRGGGYRSDTPRRGGRGHAGSAHRNRRDMHRWGYDQHHRSRPNHDGGPIHRVDTRRGGDRCRETRRLERHGGRPFGPHEGNDSGGGPPGEQTWRSVEPVSRALVYF